MFEIGATPLDGPPRWPEGESRGSAAGPALGPRWAAAGCLQLEWEHSKETTVGRSLLRIMSACGGLASAAALTAGGCASGARPSGGGASVGGSPSDLAAARMDETPIAGSSAVLTVYGMSCPLCANNVDKSLMDVPGVTRVRVDMATGKTTVDLDGKTPVTRRQLAQAVDKSGFSLQRVDAQ
jgi:copper chaperone